MKTYSISNLPDFGINILTGEACAFSRRVLCDLNVDGLELLADYFGVSTQGFASNWNSMVGGKDAVASVMLDRNSLKDVLIFALLREGWRFVMDHSSDKTTLTATNDPDEVSRLEKVLNLHIIRNWASSNSIGSRNIHQMSRRIT